MTYRVVLNRNISRRMISREMIPQKKSAQMIQWRNDDDTRRRAFNSPNSDALFGEAEAGGLFLLGLLLLASSESDD